MDKTQNSSNKKSPPRNSTPEKELSALPSNVSEPNVSIISTVSSSSSRKSIFVERGGKENQHFISENAALIEGKIKLLKLSQQTDQHREYLQEINKQISEMRERLEQERKEVHSVMNALKEISLIEQRLEKEREAANDNSDEKIQQCLEELMTAVNQERSKLELKNISSITDDQFKALVTEADSSIKAFNEGKSLESVQKLASFLPALEESLQKCRESDDKNREIKENIERLLLYRKTLKSISELCKNSV